MDLSVSKVTVPTFMQMRKQEDSCGRGVPALKSVGLACVNQRSLSRWYVWIALARSSLWMPTCAEHAKKPFRQGMSVGIVSREGHALQAT